MKTFLAVVTSPGFWLFLGSVGGFLVGIQFKQEGAYRRGFENGKRLIYKMYKLSEEANNNGR